MKKALHTIIFNVLLFTSPMSAQLVNIPDVNFRNWLNSNGYASCMSGTSLNTTCPAVLAATKINCENANISDLTGIEYFTNLDSLYCGYNNLTFLPPLNNGLKILDIDYNEITTLPALPTSLIKLFARDNLLTSLPTLPATLEQLSCLSNNLTALPALPPGLNSLTCSSNPLYNLPTLPASLTYLDCVDDSLSFLPPLPANLNYLNCGYNQLTSLPTLPDNLYYLYCYKNQITNIPALPDTCYTFNCSWNNLTSLPPLPNMLNILECKFNQISSLPMLPSSLDQLICTSNLISNLPATYPPSLERLECGTNLLTSIPANLPATLELLDCSRNQIATLPPLNAWLLQLDCGWNLLTSLPTLPGNLISLTCDSNQITSLPPLPSVLDILSVSNNPVTSLPDLPDTLVNFRIVNCPLTCLPEIMRIQYFSWAGSALNCLPNYIQFQTATPSVAGLSLCQPSGNCPTYWNISGNVFNDANGNCIHDAEDDLQYIPVKLDSAGITLQEFLTTVDGNYSFRSFNGNYQVRIDTSSLPFDVNCPASFSYNVNISAVNQHDSLVDFGLECKPGHDLVAKSISTNGVFRPGAQRIIYLNTGDASTFYGTSCVAGLAGSVQAELTGPVTYVSPAPGALAPSSVVGNTITWNVTDFSMADPMMDYNIITDVATTAQITDTVCITLTVAPLTGDNNPSNNLVNTCNAVVNSFDPNEKHMQPFGDVDTSQQWFTFTIYFQNTGNAPAEDIYILDSLRNTLNATTFTFLSSSHDVITQLLPGNVLRFNFPDINLPDSTNNEPLSHGYVQFKIRRIMGLPVGTIISNKSYIYFDYNPPVITNTVSATLTLPVGMTENFTSDINIYPNPTENLIFIQSANQSWRIIEVMDVLGKIIYHDENRMSIKSMVIDLSTYRDGVYILRLSNENSSTVSKILKSSR